jgi:phenylacetate-CoA ligase
MRWSTYFDEPVETMPTAWLRRLEAERLAAQARQCVEASNAYRLRLGIGEVTPERLAQVPLLRAEQVASAQDADPPLGELLCADLVDVVRLALVEADGSDTLAVAYTEHDLATAATLGARALWAAGLRPSDVVVDLLGVDPALGLLGAAVLSPPPGAERSLLASWARVGATALIATVERAGALAEAAGRASMSLHELGLRRLLLQAGGAEGEREELSARWGVAATGVHGHPALWPLFAAECEARDGLHFLAHGALLLEIVPPGEAAAVPLEEGAEGEAVLTHLDREATPLVRFRTGEHVLVVGTDCECGRTGIRYRLGGGA